MSYRVGSEFDARLLLNNLSVSHEVVSYLYTTNLPYETFRSASSISVIYRKTSSTAARH